ncbi:MAG TPA: glycosyltransferase family 4 protein [Verrucomicrobiae bacterium]|jgi:starch synthase|nr:glycosyltransferase family 4 protein [Verrucomicrobiae bacterium]
MNPSGDKEKFVVATPGRSVCDDSARALERTGALRFLALGTRRGAHGVSPERTRLNPFIGLAAYAAAKILPPFRAESFRFGLLPWFDRWVKRQITPGDHIISSYGYTNESFKFVRMHGGKTFLDAGNSHIENYWATVSEEHRRWNCTTPPFSPQWLELSRVMLAETDFVLSPSNYVTQSFLARGFKPERILKNIYPVNLSLFQPRTAPRPKNQPLTLINTGSLSLRKGTPYLLEAFRIVRKKIPGARLLLTSSVQDDVKPILARHNDLPIEWSPSLPHAQLAGRLQDADIFILPSLEEGLVRTACEAMACGLPAILTPNTGANDFVRSGVNGETVPIRDPQAIADSVFKWSEIILKPGYQPRVAIDRELLTFEHFEKTFIGQLRQNGFVP